MGIFDTADNVPVVALPLHRDAKGKLKKNGKFHAQHAKKCQKVVQNGDLWHRGQCPHLTSRRSTALAGRFGCSQVCPREEGRIHQPTVTVRFNISLNCEDLESNKGSGGVYDLIEPFRFSFTFRNLNTSRYVPGRLHGDEKWSTIIYGTADLRCFLVVVIIEL